MINNKIVVPEFILSFLDKSLDGAILCDAQAEGYPIIWASDSFVDFTGFTRNFIIGKSCSFLQGPETDKKTIQEISFALSKKESFRGKILNYKKDGNSFWNFLKLDPVFDKNKSLTHYVGIQTDITKLQEEKTQNEYYTNLVESSPDIFVVLSYPDLELTYFNEL